MDLYDIEKVVLYISRPIIEKKSIEQNGFGIKGSCNRNDNSTDQQKNELKQK